jgi:hypothetical protein
MTPTYTPTGLSELAVAELRAAVQLHWFRSSEILERLDLWHSALADSFLAAFEGAPDTLVDVPTDDEQLSAWDVLAAFNDWLGHDVVSSIYEDYDELLDGAK